MYGVQGKRTFAMNPEPNTRKLCYEVLQHKSECRECRIIYVTGGLPLDCLDQEWILFG
jgi:hypothetical protein